MSLAIYLDDCAFSHQLRQRLIQASHRVQIPAEAHPPLTGAADQVHFAYCQKINQVLLTMNPADFLDLHQQDADHPGILAVYQDHDPTKDMSYAGIVQAIANLEQTGVPIAGKFWVLNAFQW